MANVYVDYGAGGANNGTSMTDAYTTIVGHAFSAGDLVWIRRSSTVLNLAATYTLLTGVKYIGWPIAGDLYYGSRPADTVGWDADSPTSLPYAIISNNAGAYDTITASAATCEMHRLDIRDSRNGVQYGVNVTATLLIQNCSMTYSGTGNNSAALYFHNAANVTYLVKNCTLVCSGATTSNSAVYCIYTSTVGTYQFVNCTIKNTETAHTAAQLVYINTATPCDVYFIDCTLYDYGTATSGAMISGSSPSNWCLYNCTIDSDSGITQTQVNLTYSATNTVYATRITSNKACRHYYPAYSIINYSKFNQTVASSDYAIDPGQGSQLSGSNFTFKSGNVTTDIRCYAGTPIWVQNATFSNQVSPTTQQYPGIWSSDHGGTLGAFQYTGPKGTVSTNNVYRSGGEGFSLKFQITAGAYGDPFWKQLTPMLPALETIWVACASGARTVTFYGAYVGYGQTEYYASPNITQPSAEDIWFDLDYYGAATAVRSSATTKAFGTALTTDTSTWTGDSSITGKFRLTASFTTGQACLVPIRLYCIACAPNSYIYIDPKAVIT